MPRMQRGSCFICQVVLLGVARSRGTEPGIGGPCFVNVPFFPPLFPDAAIASRVLISDTQCILKAPCSSII